MKNSKKYADDIILLVKDELCVKDGKPALCRLTLCNECDFFYKKCNNKSIDDWLNEEYKPVIERYNIRHTYRQTNK